MIVLTPSMSLSLATRQVEAVSDLKRALPYPLLSKDRRQYP